ncbi:TolC family protein [Sphingobacterium siyangense]
MKRIIGVFLLLYLLLPEVVIGQKKINWEIAKSILYANNINLKQSFLKEKIVKNNINIARGNLYPSLSFSANNQHTMGLVFDPVSGRLITGDQWSNYATGSLGSSLVIFQGGQKQNVLESEKINLELAQLDTEMLLQELELQLLQLFTQSLINRDLWQAAGSQQELSKEQLRQEEELMKSGKRTLIDVGQAKAKHATDNLNTVNAKNAYEISILKLRQILDLNDSEEIQLQSISQDIMSVTGEYNIHNDVYIKKIDKQLALQEISIKLARSTYFPTLVFNSSYGTNYSSQRMDGLSGETMAFWRQINQNRTLYGNLALTLPLFDGNRTKNNLNSAKLTKRNLLYEKEKQFVDRKQKYAQAELEYRYSEEELKALQLAYEVNKTNYEAINERYKIGKNSSIDLYKALTEYNISEYKLISSRYRVFFQKINLRIIRNMEN